jgi:hypothetical protein
MARAADHIEPIARAILRAACATADEYIGTDTPWYVWIQKELDEIYGDLEVRRGPDKI